MSRYEQGDEAGALEALRRATTAPRYDVYWTDHVGLFERALAASTGLSYSERAIVAMGIVAATWRPDLELVTACTGQIGVAPEWLPVCGDFGRRLEADGGILLDTALGVAIQAAVYEAIGDEQRLAVASRKREALSTMTTLDYLEDAQLLLMEDERLLSDYLTEFDTYGELAAMRFLETEVARLQAMPDYDPCG